MDERTRRGYRGGVFCIVLAALSATACASHSPLASAKLAQAERAFNEAQQAGAAVNATTELKIAEDRLKNARAAVADKKYDRAILTAEQAAADADYARARASNQRINQIADEMSRSIRALREELERTPQ